MGRALSLLVHAAGTAAVTALTACGTLPPTASPPAEPSTTSKPLGVVAFSDGASITLYTGIGPCANGARFAEHMTAKGNKIPGCWLFHSGYVLVGSLPSGEWISIPHTRFKLVSEL